MYDDLTREQLRTLHQLLYLVGLGIYRQMFGPDDMPKIPVTGEEWQRLYTQKLETSAVMRGVFDEMQRRDEMADADA